MLSFREHCTGQTKRTIISEGAINSNDIFKRAERGPDGNKLQFIKKAIAGELVDTKGNKIPKIKANSKLIAYLKANDVATPELNRLIIDAFGKSLTALAIDKPANGFSKSGNSKRVPSGAEWEEIICTAYNMLAKGVDKEKAYQMAGISSWKNSYDDGLVTASSIVRKAFSGKAAGVMNHYGASHAELTKEWDRYFIQTTGKPANAATKTPKTDMYIGNKHISLKKAGGSQLMSGGKAETLATLAAAYDAIPKEIKTNQFDAAWKKLTGRIKKDFIKVNLPAGKSIGHYKSPKAAEDKDEIGRIVMEAIRNQKVLGEAIRTLLESKEAKMEVVREAMTGRQKFVETLPVATHIMIFDAKGNGDYKPINNSLISSYADKVKFDISFKSSGVGGSSWTALKGYIKEESDQDILTKIISETYDECMNQCITENVFSKTAAATKRAIFSVKSFLQQFLNKVWSRIKRVIASSFEMMQRVLGLRMVASSPTIVY